MDIRATVRINLEGEGRGGGRGEGEGEVREVRRGERAKCEMMKSYAASRNHNPSRQ